MRAHIVTAIVATVLAIPVVAAAFIVLHGRPIDVDAIHDAASLPDVVSVCGRDYHRDGGGVSQQAITTELGGRPILVDPGPFPPCPAGACARSDTDTPCATTLFVRVGEDEFVQYVLRGGP